MARNTDACDSLLTQVAFLAAYNLTRQLSPLSNFHITLTRTYDLASDPGSRKALFYHIVCISRPFSAPQRVEGSPFLPSLVSTSQPFSTSKPLHIQIGGHKPVPSLLLTNLWPKPFSKSLSCVSSTLPTSSSMNSLAAKYRNTQSSPTPGAKKRFPSKNSKEMFQKSKRRRDSTKLDSVAVSPQKMTSSMPGLTRAASTRRVVRSSLRPSIQCFGGTRELKSVMRS
jgi:hypothetical protein